MARRSPRLSTGLWIVGLVVVAAGFGAVAASVFRDQSTVASFARTPVGCETIVEVERSALFHVYLETRGRIDDIGDCTNDDRVYDVNVDGPVGLQVTDPSGRTIEVVPLSTEVSYELPDYAGVAIATVRLEAGERYRVQVVAEDPRAVVAIGRRVVPVESGWALAGAITVMAGGAVLVAAIVVTTVTRRRRRRGPWAPPTLDDRAVW